MFYSHRSTNPWKNFSRIAIKEASFTRSTSIRDVYINTQGISTTTYFTGKAMGDDATPKEHYLTLSYAIYYSPT